VTEEPHIASLQPSNPLHLPRVHLLIMAVLWVVLAVLVIPTWGWTYWDFGDGNYLYVGRRINDGLVPYRDILAPQPPLHLISSALAQWIGGLLLNSELLGARVFSLLVRMAQSFCIYLVAMRMFGCAYRALAAAAVYLALPIGFWWSLCFQSENLELVFLLIAMWGVLTLSKRGVIIAGVASALAMHCNMTGVPYFLCNALFLGVRRPRLFAWYAPVALGTWGLGAAATYAWAGYYYLDNTVLNQVGSFPRADILAESGQTQFDYFKGKILNEGTAVLRLEGTLIIGGLIAMAIRWREMLKKYERNSDEYRRWEYAAWYCIGMLLSIGFVMKGGTVNYIFVLGEPAVALLAADALVRLSRLLSLPIVSGNAAQWGIKVFAVAGIVFMLGNPNMWRNIYWTLTEVQSELRAEGVEWIRDVIELTTQPGDPILAPPFYAYATNRTVAGELAENYLWQIKWMNESFDGVEGEGVLKMNEIAASMRRREIPLLVLDMNQTGRVPAIQSAARQFYQPLDPEYVRTRHVTLLLAVPVGAPVPELPPPPRGMRIMIENE